jgi:DNA polymerase-3 subunit gamma/tau
MHVAFSKATEEILQSPSTRASLEMALVRLARRPPLVPIDDLMRRLGDLEARLASGAPAPGGGRPAARETQQRPRGRPGDSGDDPEPAAYEPPPAARFEPPPAPRFEPPPAPRFEPELRSEPPSRRPEPRIETPPSGEPLPIRSSDDPRFERFARVVSVVRERSARLAPLLERAALCEVDDKGVIIALDPQSFESTFLRDKAALETLEAAAREAIGPNAGFRIVDLARGLEAATLAKTYDEATKAKRVEADKAVRNHPLIAAAEKHLGAQVKDVRIPDG